MRNNFKKTETHSKSTFDHSIVKDESIDKRDDSLLGASSSSDSFINQKTKAIIKRSSDIFISLFGIIITTPVVPYIAWRIKKDSKGPVFYTQERIGRNGKPFMILKFRTMYTDAESNGPALSSSTDPRVTPFGRLLRKWRIDEAPQFINVLKGEMAIIGPRPERQYFIDQIIKEEPLFNLLLKLKPGITSLGMVKFGYAENLEKILQRIKFELFYMNNQSLRLDFKILLYTIKTLFNAEGK